MNDLRKASNPFYLAFFLFMVCGLSTFVMAVTAMKTAKPIRDAQDKETAESLALILPAFDNNPAQETKTITDSNGNPLNMYIARSGGKIAGYVVESSAYGFGGTITGLVGFEPDGKVGTVIIKSNHNETPGIGTRVTNRENQRTISQVLRGEKPPEGLPANKALDSYKGKTAEDTPWTKKQVDFVSGATISSTAVRNLVWNAATAMRDYLSNEAEENKQ